MSVKLNPYLNFRTEARAAMEFYKSVFGGNLQVMTYKDGGMSQGPDTDNLVMHSELSGDHGLTLMGADNPPDMPLQSGNTITIALTGNDEKMLRGYWDKLSNGGTIAMPLEKAPWGDHFGMCTDKFGIQWMVNISAS